MITKDEAKQLVEKDLEKHHNPYEPMDLVILDELTIEEDFGWVFAYDAKQHLETGNFSFAIAGNAPYIVNKLDGSLHVTGTAHPIEYYIENYRRTGNPHSKRSG